MAGTFVAAANNGVYSTSITVTKPSGTTSGDWMLGIASGNWSALTYTPPSGFSELGSGLSTTVSDQDTHIYTKTAGGSEPADYTWTVDNDSHQCGIVTIRGVLGIAASATSTSDTGNSSPITVTFPSVTTTATNQTILLIAAVDQSATADSTWSSLPSGFTERLSTDFLFSGTSYGALWVAEGVAASQGATGAYTATCTLAAGNGAWAVWTLALADNVPYVIPRGLVTPLASHVMR